MIHVIALDADAAEQVATRIDRWVRQQFSSWTEPMPRLWIVDGPIAGDQIYNGISPFVAAGDRLLIVKAGVEALWHGVSPEVAEWLAANFPGSITERIPSPTEGTAKR
jgi:hypothetical protein